MSSELIKRQMKLSSPALTMTLGLKTKKHAFILNKSKPLYVSKESTFNQI